MNTYWAVGAQSLCASAETTDGAERSDLLAAGQVHALLAVAEQLDQLRKVLAKGDAGGVR
jgi:hypothetical protein